MDLIEHFSRLFAYDGWANQEVLAGLRAVRDSTASGPEIDGPHFSAERSGWSGSNRSRRPFRSGLSSQPRNANGKRPSYRHSGKNTWPPAAKPIWPRPVSYQNSKGETWSSRKDDILMHLITHSAYHRGQVAAAVRAAGSTPAYTDFIHSIRQGFVK